MRILLKVITKDNYKAVGKLHIPNEQQKHLSENIWSIAESLLHETHEARAIYLHEEVVGFVMWVRMTEKMSCIWRFMIASEYQNIGIGREALVQVIEEMKRREGIEEISICYSQDNTVAKNLYFSVGFTETEFPDDDVEGYATIRSVKK